MAHSRDRSLDIHFWRIRPMILTGEEIRRRLGNDIIIDPFDEARLNPNSYNLSLHHELLVYEEVVLDLRAPNRFRRVEIPPEGLVLNPGQLYLGRSIERTETRNLVPMIEGRCSVGRLGLRVRAGFGDVGYCGFWTVELHSVQPVRVYAGVPICQVYYFEVVGDVRDYCSDKYQHNQEIQPSYLYRELGCSEPNPQLELNFESLVSSARR